MILHITDSLALSFVYKNQPVDFTNSFVFTRLRGSDSHFIGILYEHLKERNIPASDHINLSYRNSEEKIAQMPRLARAGIKVPETIIAREESFKANRNYILDQMSFPLVYKVDGSQGRDVHLVHALSDLERLIAKKKPRELFILQELIPNNFDTRTLVAFSEVLGTIKREAQNGSFLNNVSQGATVDKYQLTDTEKAIAVKATAVCRLDFAGVDIVHTPKGPVILEVNKSPQINGFERVFGKDIVFSTIAKHLDHLLNKRD